MRNKPFFPLLVGVLIGAGVLFGIRFLRYQDPTVHYHANFTIYINGVREELKDPSFYEELSSCDTADHRPQHRAHLHDNKPDVIHVHDHMVTWGAFLANVRYGVGNDYLATPTKTYLTDATYKLHFILNGKDVSNISNVVVGDKDRLLISYGVENSIEIQKQFDTVASTAATIDKVNDPAVCSGSVKRGWWGRLSSLL